MVYWFKATTVLFSTNYHRINISTFDYKNELEIEIPMEILFFNCPYSDSLLYSKESQTSIPTLFQAGNNTHFYYYSNNKKYCFEWTMCIRGLSKQGTGRAGSLTWCDISSIMEKYSLSYFL